MLTIEWCEWCVVDHGRTHAQRECCKARALAKAPLAMRREAIKAMAPAEAEEAQYGAFLFRARALAKRPKEARQRAYTLERGETGMDGAELLRRLTIEEYERQNWK